MTKEMSNFTPGPWAKETCPDGDIVITNENELTSVAVVHSHKFNDLTIANARLIAAAPELLEALEAAEDDLTRFVRGLDDEGPYRDTINQARAAIKAARSG